MKRYVLRLWRRLRGTPGGSARAATAVAVGLFIGCQPVYGLHAVLVLAVCLPLRLDAVLAYLVANISNPLVAPLLLFSEIQVGAYLTTGNFVPLDLAQARAAGAASFARYLLLGALVEGAALALLGFAITWLIADARRGNERPAEADDFEAAAARVRARYRGAKMADRCYVAGKLAFDPVCRLLGELEGPLGHVLDLGCGRGQLALLLWETGRTRSVLGMDSDARKIEVAQAAGPEATFRAHDLARVQLPRADTLLLIDVLHYLPLPEQDALLRSAAEALTPGGRLLVRELDAEPTARSALTRGFEWVARKTGLNRGRATAYRPARDLVSLLERAGLRCVTQRASERTPFANVLIVGSPTSNEQTDGSPSNTRVSAANA